MFPSKDLNVACLGYRAADQPAESNSSGFTIRITENRIASDPALKEQAWRQRRSEMSAIEPKPRSKMRKPDIAKWVAHVNARKCQKSRKLAPLL